MTKGLELQVRLGDVNEMLISELESYGKRFPGNCVVKFNVLGAFEDRMINLEMLSRKVTVDLNDELIKELDTIEEVNYRVLTN